MTASLAATEIARRVPGIAPRVGIVLGSGLGGIASRVADPVVIPYAALPGFPMPSVEGHPGRMTLGTMGGLQVAVMQGRHHLYEGEDAAGVRTFVRTFHQIGCEIVVLTGAAGSVRDGLLPGDLMIVTDHINLMGHNPLVGPNDPTFGPRFFSLNNAYEPVLRARLAAAAENGNIAIGSGVYAGVLGPTFETPAERRMMRNLGADVVGMSIVTEAIVARHCGLRVAACAVVADWDDGTEPDASEGEGAVIHIPDGAAPKMERLLIGFLEGLQREWAQRS